jgi:hypothetical protein
MIPMKDKRTYQVTTSTLDNARLQPRPSQEQVAPAASQPPAKAEPFELPLGGAVITRSLVLRVIGMLKES